MDLSIEHATYKTKYGEVLYVKLPQDSKEFSLTHDAMNYYISYRKKKSKKPPLGYYHIKIPFKLWRIFGFAFDLTTDQIGFLGFENKEDYLNKTLRLQVFEENPFCKPQKDDYSFYTHKNISVQEEWHIAEKRTGKWIVLFHYDNHDKD